MLSGFWRIYYLSFNYTLSNWTSHLPMSGKAMHWSIAQIIMQIKNSFLVIIKSCKFYLKQIYDVQLCWNVKIWHEVYT